MSAREGKSPDWLALAARLVADGHHLREAAELIGVPRSSVVYWLRQKAQNNCQMSGGADALFIKPHEYRKVRVLIDPAVKADAVQAFAAGRIDRAQLSRMLAG